MNLDENIFSFSSWPHCVKMIHHGEVVENYSLPLCREKMYVTKVMIIKKDIYRNLYKIVNKNSPATKQHILE